MTDIKFYLVGGAIRDKTIQRYGKLGHPIKPADNDFVVTGATCEQMKEMFGEPVGKDFPVFLGKVPLREDLGIVEIAMARKETKTGEGHQDFTFEVGPHITIEEDLARRDFTINAMAQIVEHPWYGDTVDPFNGYKDTLDKVIRHTNDRAFIEDPLRVLRMARFAAKLGFRIALPTLALAKKMDIGHLTIERIWLETNKSLQTEYPSLYFLHLNDKYLDKLKQFLPEISTLCGVEQPYPWHDEDAFFHTMLVLDEGAKESLSGKAMFALLVHDVGKAVTPKEILPNHYDHDKNGVPIVKKICARLKVPNDYENLAVWFCENHMTFHKINEMSPGTIISFAKEIAYKQFDYTELFKMANCDVVGRVATCREKTNFNRLQLAIAVVKCTSADDIVAKGFKGPQVGQLLHQKMVEEFTKRDKLK